MTTDKPVKIKISGKNKDYYEKLGYINLKIGEFYFIKSCDVIKTVATNIYVLCSNCNIERYIRSQNYHNQLKKSNFYVCQKCNNIKSSITNLSKYGTKCPLQNDNIIEKTKKTLIDNYGVDNISKLDSVKYDRRNSFTTDDFKKKAQKKWLENYGVTNPSKSDYIKLKKQKTLFDNYGVTNPSHSIEIFEKAQKTGKRLKKHECGLMYRGSYEKHFLDFCIDNDIIVEKGPTIEYIHESKNKYYHSDFYIPILDLICEIKSTYYYEKYIDINISKKKYSELKHNFLFIIDKKYNKLLEIKKED